LKLRIKQGGTGICIDGPVGSGKTSLANVASYSCMLDYINTPVNNPIIIPCDKILQLDNKSDEQIKREVFLNLAQTLISKKFN
jgi:ABC-type lipoprotein export system ATPase subunit